MPSPRLAEKAVERFGLLQVHGFPAPTHVQLPLELAPPKGGERPAALRPRNGDSASWQRQRNAPRCRRLLVAGNPVRDLLLRAKHLFVAATFAYPMRAGPWAHRRLEISLTASLLAGFAVVVAARQILVRRRHPLAEPEPRNAARRQTGNCDDQ